MCEVCGPLAASVRRGRRDAPISRRAVLGLAAGAVMVGRLPTDVLAAPAPGSTPVDVAPGLRIRPRSAWAEGLPPTGPMQAEIPRFLLVHHTATGNAYGPDDVPGIMRGAFNFHTGPERGWPDVAYNFFIDRFGEVWEARAGSLAGPVMGDATGGSQGHAQLVCLIGNFTDQMPTEASLASLHRTLAWLAARDNIDVRPGATVDIVSRGSNLWPAGAAITTATIAGHRDMSATACPGDMFYPYVVNELPQQVSAVLGAPPAVTTVPPTEPPPATSTTTSTTSTTSSTTSTTTTTTTTVTSSSSIDTVTTSRPSTPAAVPEVAARPAEEEGGGVVVETAASESSGGSSSPLAVAGIAAGAGAIVAGLVWRDRRLGGADPPDAEPLG